MKVTLFLSLKSWILLFFFLFCRETGSASVVINEVVYNTFAGSSEHQWVELYNYTNRTVSLRNWKIQTAGSSFETILNLPNITIDSQEFLLIGGEHVAGAHLNADLDLPDENNITAGIRLLSPGGYSDTLLYGQPNINNLPDDIAAPATNFAPVTPPGQSLARISDGHDTDNNAEDWFVCTNPTPGYSNVYLIDLSLDELTISESDDRITAAVRIVNPSSVAVPQNEASLRIFLNNECQGFYPLPELLPEYHSTEFIHFDGLTDGYYRLDVRLLYQFDADLSNNHQHSAFIAGASPLILNELLFKQTAGNQEWVEIYNRSEMPLFMEDFYFEDAASTFTHFTGIIPPKTYMVICRYKQQFLDFYHYVDPDLVIESTSWAILNNDRETLFIADQYGNVFDYFEYTAPASYPADLSLERINPYDDESLWDRSLHPEMSTPAAPNSRLPLQYDLAVEESYLLKKGALLEHTLIVSNNGYNDIDKFRLKCYAYYDEGEEGVLIYEVELQMPADKTYSFLSEIPDADYTTYRYLVESEEDLDPSNNVSFSYHNNGALPVVINEIMFRPHTGEPRWLELKINKYYKYLFSVTLETERYIIDVPLHNANPYRSRTPFGNSSGYEYIILVNNAADSLFIKDNYAIGNALIVTGLTSIYVSGEELKLYDPSGNIFENFTFDPGWSTTRGVSAERINPLLPSSNDNWAHSIHPAGSTPGKENSIFTPYIPTETALELSPNPFSPYRGERTIISFSLPERLSKVNCRIFDLKGRLVKNVVDQEIFAAKGSIIWDGRGTDGRTLPVGVYIIQMEATGSDTERIYRQQATAVIGR